jgi:hypothetical protein
MRNEGRINVSDCIPIDTEEERMVFHLLDVQSPIRGRYQATNMYAAFNATASPAEGSYVPSYEIFSFAAEMNIIRKSEVILPLDDFLVRLVGRLRAERRIAN